MGKQKHFFIQSQSLLVDCGLLIYASYFLVDNLGERIILRNGPCAFLMARMTQEVKFLLNGICNTA